MKSSNDMEVTLTNAYNNHTVTNIQHDDSIRLLFEAYDQLFAIHLTPNLDLLHPQATFVYDGKSEPIHPHQFRIYRGHVYRPSISNRRWQYDKLGVIFPLFDQINNDDKDSLGWARLVLRHDLTKDPNYPVFEGSFEMLNDVYHIKSTDMYNKTKRRDDVTPMITVSQQQQQQYQSLMVIYRDSDTSLVSLEQFDLPADNASSSFSPQCATDRLNYNAPYMSTHKNNNNDMILRPGHPASRLDGLFMPPSSFTKRATTGCPTTKKIAYMGAAADCTYTKHYQSKQQAQIQIITDWNSVSALFERQFNIQLGLVNITVMDELCPTTPSSAEPWNRACSDTYTLDDRLSDFSRWRGTMSNDGIALWHLLTNCATGVEVGIAWVGQLCQSEASSQTTSGGQTQYVAGAGVSSIIRDEWKVIAHEIGHGFGASHDCNSANCPCSGSQCTCCPLSATVCDAGGTYIMNPTSNVSAQEFSPCSVTTICKNFPSIGSCLQDPGQRITKQLQMCGNGIVEQGEECDPGNQTSSCCDSTTCKFINNAVCDDVNDSCCNQCQYQPSTYQCRPASTSCDIPEFCTGTSGTCPPDTYIQDGTDCGNGLKCATGLCTSRDDQCLHRGSSLNISKACPSSNSCSLSCNNGAGSSCLVFSGGFINGTPCGANGVCKDGSCDEGSIASQALYWLSTHKYIAIPVGVVLCLLLLGCLAWTCYSGCCGRGGWRNRNNKKNQNRPNTLQVTSPPPPSISTISSPILSSPTQRHYGNNRVSSPPLDSAMMDKKQDIPSDISTPAFASSPSTPIPSSSSPPLPPPPPPHQPSHTTS
ncbi:Metallo-peptidase family M12-domain-containing protein [Halteromyces radiatus]|uniref:Metallo-peptidase family M12-domain-containing protein n=1 Tax=Halteromyces radiatus TaxID=101107 RepID=UPI00221FC21D|nr:Metallo-peptidase family M12-domain-containing protein [Halteromyces radiatus]KAI8086477.1 Metallo-peptidase family M12-domain-containing protein [Halteromyces radiatus]